jgi:hypothetical protein
MANGSKSSKPPVSKVGPQTRPLLVAVVSEDELRQIEEGTLVWNIERETLGAVGGDEEVLRREIAKKQQARRYVLEGSDRKANQTGSLCACQRRGRTPGRPRVAERFRTIPVSGSDPPVPCVLLTSAGWSLRPSSSALAVNWTLNRASTIGTTRPLRLPMLAPGPWSHGRAG